MWVGRQPEPEGGADIDLTLGQHLAAMLLDKALDDRQADAGAGKFVHAMQPLEQGEQLILVVLLEAGAIVLD